MNKMEIILLIICVALLVIVGYLVPLLIQIKKTATRAAETFDSINLRLPAIMTNLEEITTNMSSISRTAGRQVDEFALNVDRINGVMKFYLEKELFLREQVTIPLVTAFRSYGAFIKGIRVFLDYMKTGSSPGKNRQSL